MESPLLTKSEHNVENITVHGDPSPADEHIVDITTNGDPSPADGHIFDTTINGDPSLADEQTSHEAFQWSCPFINGIVWILVELAVTLVQIVAAIFLILTKDEQHPELGLPLFVWIICYTCASIVSFPVICWRLWHYIQNASSETRISESMFGLGNFLESVFVGLVVMFLWYFFIMLASRDDTTQHFWLWLALLSFSCVRYVLPNLQRAVRCFEWPLFFVLEQFLKQFEEGIATTINWISALFWVIMGTFVCIFVSISAIFGCIFVRFFGR